MKNAVQRLDVKLVLAAVSGVACWLLFEFDPLDDMVAGMFVSYALFGALFAAGVLLPYLGDGRAKWLRAAGLVAVSAFSFWAAIQVAGHGFEAKTPDTVVYVLASLVGAAIVLVGGRLLSPLGDVVALAVAGGLYAVFGGLIFAVSPWMWLAFPAWHVLVASAIHAARQRQARAGNAARHEQ